MYCHSKNYEIRYTDTDFNDYLKLSSLLSLMEESACLSADELGFGYSALKPKNYGFILANWYIEMSRPVKLGDILTIHTWPVAPKKLIVLRDFELYIGKEKVGVATTRWCLVNLNDFSLMPSSAVFSDGMVYNDKRSIEIVNWKIPLGEFEECGYYKIVAYSDYDHYNHVNNTKYADFFLDTFKIDDLYNKYFKCVKITYVKQCKAGDMLKFYKKRQDDGSYILECRVCDELRAQMQIYFND